MERLKGVNLIYPADGHRFCTLHPAEGLYGQVRYRGYMRDSRFKSKSGRHQPHRRDCTGKGPFTQYTYSILGTLLLSRQNALILTCFQLCVILMIVKADIFKRKTPLPAQNMLITKVLLTYVVPFMGKIFTFVPSLQLDLQVHAQQYTCSSSDCFRTD